VDVAELPLPVPKFLSLLFKPAALTTLRSSYQLCFSAAIVIGNIAHKRRPLLFGQKCPSTSPSRWCRYYVMD
jgi:hypothetical protein